MGTYSDSILVVGDAVKFDDVICILGSTCGDGLDITRENAHFYPIIRQLHTNTDRDGDYSSKNIQVPFVYSVISEYQRCCVDNYNNICNIPWRLLVKMFQFAVYVHNDDFLEAFAMRVLHRLLNERSVPVLRYLLSFSGCESYLSCRYSDLDWEYDPFENHCFQTDCLVAHIPTRFLKAMFIRLPCTKRRLLMGVMPDKTFAPRRLLKNIKLEAALCPLDGEFLLNYLYLYPRFNCAYYPL